MLISLIVLSLEQIYVPFWVSYDIVYSGPITLLEPLVVLIRRSHLVFFCWVNNARTLRGGILG